MNFQKILRANFEALLKSARRFPLTLAFGAAGGLMGAYVAPFQAHVWKEAQTGFLLACWLSVPLSFALGLLSEARGFGPRGRAACAAVSLVAAALAWRTLTPLPGDVLALRFSLWFAAAVAAAGIMPLFAGQDTVRFRHFNLVLLQRLLATVALSVPLFLGLSLALWALQALFGVEVHGGLWLSLWFLVTGVFGTAYFAGSAPRLDAEGTFENPAFLSALTRFILLPLSLTYLLILYAYVARVLILREWPQGMVSGLILAFAATGMLTHLLLKDSDSGGRWGRWYSRRFYLVLAPLLVMLFAAVWRRYSEYGLTEERVLVWVAAIWLAGMSAYFLVRRNARVEAIPLTIGIVAFAISVGPFNLTEVAIDSQIRRLERHLEAAHRLREGKLVRSDAQVPKKSESEISQILRYLGEREALERLRPWFAPAGGVKCADCLVVGDTVPGPESLVTALGMEWLPWGRLERPEDSNEKDFYAVDEVLDVRDYALAVPVELSRWNEGVSGLGHAYPDPRRDAYRVTGNGRAELLVHRDSTLLTSKFLAIWAAGLDAAGGDHLPAKTLRLDWSDAGGVYSLRVHHLRVSAWKTPRARIEYLSGTLLLTPAR